MICSSAGLLRRILCLSLLLFLLLPLHAQKTGREAGLSPSEDITFDAKKAFSPPNTYGTPVHEDNDGKKHYLVAVTGMLLPIFVIHAWSRFVVNAGWAQVSASSFCDWRRTVEFDDDYVWTNFVLHPFQGSLYYMAARNANLNRFESLGLTALGDFLWEWFAETTPPSVNDLTYSFIGGFAVGEMMYRLSLEAEQIADFFGYVVNPMRIWSDPLTGIKPRGRVGNIYEISMKYKLGTVRSYSYSAYDSVQAPAEHFPIFFSPDLTIVYNDPYGHDSNDPYSQFEFRFALGVGAGSGRWRGMVGEEQDLMYDILLSSSGMLFSRSPDFGSDRKTTVGMVLDYDVRWQSLIDFSALASGFAFKQQIQHATSTTEWQVHLAWNLLGMTDYYYFHRSPDSNMAGARRDYSYMFGPAVFFRWNWLTKKGFAIKNDVHSYANYDFAFQTQPNQSTGWEFITFYDVNLEMPLPRELFLGLGLTCYIKKAVYAEVENVFQHAYFASFYLKKQVH
ncbi:MAG: DUF3943 domain-containing protein [Treponema sp.]|nr:DUF3943 domain-containing protein [Treponema sp.]